MYSDVRYAIQEKRKKRTNAHKAPAADAYPQCLTLVSRLFQLKTAHICIKCAVHSRCMCNLINACHAKARANKLASSNAGKLHRRSHFQHISSYGLCVFVSTVKPIAHLIQLNASSILICLPPQLRYGSQFNIKFDFIISLLSNGWDT